MAIPTQLTALDGLIRRRVLLNYRVRPEYVAPMLPPPFRPRLVHGWSIVGVCAIRLEHLRPAHLRLPVGIATENAAHRIAVEWTDVEGRPQVGVYIPRRDSDSPLTRLAGATLFPAHHSAARFTFREDWDGTLHLRAAHAQGLLFAIAGRPSTSLPDTSAFDSPDAASDFFRSACDGYSPGRNPSALDGVRLEVADWRIQVLEVCHAYARELLRQFPSGSLELDSAMLMRDVPSRWQGLPPLRVDPAASARLVRRAA